MCHKKSIPCLSLDFQLDIIHCAHLPAVQDIETGEMPKALPDWTFLTVSLLLINERSKG